MRKHVRSAWIILSTMSILFAGCSVRSGQALVSTASPVVASQPSPTRVPTRAATSTPTVLPAPMSTPTIPPTATLTPTVFPSATFTPTPQPAPTDTPILAPPDGGVERGFTERGDPFMGSPTAPIVLEEFSSYQCGFCGLYSRDTLPQLLAGYVETGQVLYVFRDFPLRSQPQSLLAAEAAACAGQVGGADAYWAMHDTLFARQTEWSGRGNAAQLFAGYATELGMDADALGDCMDSGAMGEQAEADLAEGLERGVRGTPTFFIDGQLLVGAQPYAVFARAIDAALAKEASSSAAPDLVEERIDGAGLMRSAVARRDSQAERGNQISGD